MKNIIKEQYKKFLEELSEFNLLQRVVDSAFKREFEVLDEYEKNNGSSKIIRHDAFCFENPFTGELEKYYSKQTSLNSLKEITVFHKNSQYCWLLVGAFEKFEKYLRFSYENVAQKKDIEQRFKVNKILTYFSENYDFLKTNEKVNNFEINLKVAVLLVEQLRHCIVHCQGVVEDLEIFANDVINESGINNNKNEHKLFIKQFFIGNKINLIEHRFDDDYNFQMHYDIYQRIVSYLISYAYLVNKVTAESKE